MNALISWTVWRRLIGAYTAPAVQVANIATTAEGPGATRLPTGCPGSTPAARSVPAGRARRRGRAVAEGKPLAIGGDQDVAQVVRKAEQQAGQAGPAVVLSPGGRGSETLT